MHGAIHISVENTNKMQETLSLISRWKNQNQPHQETKGDAFFKKNKQLACYIWNKNNSVQHPPILNKKSDCLILQELGTFSAFMFSPLLVSEPR